MAEMDEDRHLNCEEHLMRLLGLKTLEELNRVLSESADERVLETMEPLYDLYDLEVEDDLIESAIWEIEDAENSGTEAIFATKEGGMTVIPVSNPAPNELRMFREFSRSPYRILPRPKELDRCNWVWLTFVRRGDLDEFLIYEEMIRRAL
jgi:hypothetical protein